MITPKVVYRLCGEKGVTRRTIKIEDEGRDMDLVDLNLYAAAPMLYDFIKHFADQPCDELPGEYPEAGESGKMPCYPCQAKELLKKARIV